MNEKNKTCKSKILVASAKKVNAIQNNNIININPNVLLIKALLTVILLSFSKPSKKIAQVDDSYLYAYLLFPIFYQPSRRNAPSGVIANTRCRPATTFAQVVS